MIVSDQARTAFLHLPKTGGTSVARLLDQLWPDARTVGGKHSGVRTKAFGELDESYFTFAFVRNPWDRLVSWHAMLSDRARKPQRIRSARFRALVDYVDDGCSDFEGFVELLAALPPDAPPTLDLVAQSQCTVLTDRTGSMRIDVIGRFESLEHDLNLILRLNPYRQDPTGPRLAHHNRSKRSDYRSYYTTAARRAADELVGVDAELFGYEF